MLPVPTAIPSMATSIPPRVEKCSTRSDNIASVIEDENGSWVRGTGERLFYHRALRALRERRRPHPLVKNVLPEPRGDVVHDAVRIHSLLPQRVPVPHCYRI